MVPFVSSLFVAVTVSPLAALSIVVTKAQTRMPSSQEEEEK
jgi:hypothetical protein